MILRRLLIRAYPRVWRNEFGPELAGILAERKLTPALIADILAGAALQHFRHDLWKICALGLALWTSSLLIMAFEGFVDRPVLLWRYFAGQLLLFVAGAWTNLREHSGIWRATAASAKAALVPVAACIVVPSVSMLHYWAGSREIHGHNITYWIWKNFILTVLTAMLFGLAGASFGHFVERIRTTAHPRT